MSEKPVVIIVEENETGADGSKEQFFAAAASHYFNCYWLVMDSLQDHAWPADYPEPACIVADLGSERVIDTLKSRFKSGQGNIVLITNNRGSRHFLSRFVVAADLDRQDEGLVRTIQRALQR
ncbi:MAG: hypothetical protein WC516_03480 [Patescibacteria group bacterium]